MLGWLGDLLGLGHRREYRVVRDPVTGGEVHVLVSETFDGIESYPLPSMRSREYAAWQRQMRENFHD